MLPYLIYKETRFVIWNMLSKLLLRDGGGIPIPPHSRRPCRCKTSFLLSWNLPGTGWLIWHNAVPPHLFVELFMSSTESTASAPVEPGVSTPAELPPPSPAGDTVETPAVTQEPSGVATPDMSAPPPPTRAKTKGVADIVFMVDVSGSMKPCIDALRTNIEAFINSLSKGEANNAPPVKDWRGKVVGYRDIEAAQSEGIPWIVDNPFVRDAAALKVAACSLKGGRRRR